MNHPSHLQLRDLEKAINADIRKKAEKAGGTPPWLKDYSGQLEDPEYAELSLAERGLLKDLRLLALRRNNKIPNDEAYLRQQLRLSSRTRVAAKMARLIELGFLQPHPDAQEVYTKCAVSAQQVHTSGATTAQQLQAETDNQQPKDTEPPTTILEPGESQVTLDRRGVEKTVRTKSEEDKNAGDWNGHPPPPASLLVDLVEARKRRAG